MRLITRPRDRIIRAQDSLEHIIGNTQLINNSSTYHTTCRGHAYLPPTDYKTTPCRPPAAAGSTIHARVARPRCPVTSVTSSFYRSLRPTTSPPPLLPLAVFD